MGDIIEINLVQDYIFRKLADAKFVQELIKKMDEENNQ